VREDFTLDVLYPWLTELQKQYADLKAFKHEREGMMDRFKKIKRFNVETMDFEYEYDSTWETNEFKEVNNIVDYSIPMVTQWMLKGQNLFDSVSNQMKWEVVGIVPEYRDEGYFIMHVGDSDIFVYRFKVEKIIMEDENFFGMSTYLVDLINSRMKSYENLKHELIRKYSDLPVPYTISIQSKVYPLMDTLLPIVKRNGLVKIKNGI